MAALHRTGVTAIALSLFAGIALPRASSRGAIMAGVPWPQPPAVVVDGPAGDPRTALVYAAVAHWNEVLAGLGSGFRFARVSTGGSGGPGVIRVVLSDSTDLFRMPCATATARR